MSSGINFSKMQRVSKPAVFARGGMVAAQHRRAAEVGAAVLRDGGNAVDAAIATSFAIGVLEPWMSGLGGGGYMVILERGAERARVVDFGMVSPAGLDPSDYPLSGGTASDLFPWPAVKDDRNVSGPMSVAVPGVVDGMRLAHETFASKDWASLIAPAARLAREGLLVDWYAQLLISGVVRDLARFPKTQETFLDADGYPIASAWTALAEKRADLSTLADTLDALAAEGGRDFYEGALADRVASDLEAAGSAIRASDLAAYTARLSDALLISHGEGVLHTAPELTAGPTLARFSELFSGSRRERSWLGPDAYAGYAESLMTAYEERLRVMGDVEGGRGCTTHFNVVDGDGTMVAVTQTLLSIFGSRMMLPGTGILMNNGLMWFDPEQGKPNSLGPAKRCLSNMCPVVGVRGDGYRFAIGASGGRKIMPAVAQLSSFMLDYGMDIDAAFHTPRIDVSGADTVVMDENLNSGIKAHLERTFNAVAAPRTVYPYNFACPSGVADDGTEFSGATEIMSPWGDAAGV